MIYAPLPLLPAFGLWCTTSAESTQSTSRSTSAAIRWPRWTPQSALSRRESRITQYSNNAAKARVRNAHARNITHVRTRLNDVDLIYNLYMLHVALGFIFPDFVVQRNVQNFLTPFPVDKDSIKNTWTWFLLIQGANNTINKLMLGIESHFIEVIRTWKISRNGRFLS